MVIAVGGLLASFSVLTSSDGKAVESWSVPPSTWLAAFAGISTALYV